MFTRFLTSAPIGLGVTAALLFVMQFLVDIGPDVFVTDPPDYDLTFVADIRDTPVAPKETLPEPIDDPQPAPPRPETNERYTGPVVAVPKGPALPTGGPEFTGLTFGNDSGALINIMKVQPVYPTRAITRGLSGYVVVQFDVTPQGTVSNVSVLESSHSIFEKAARDAVLRFKYQARVVDGVAVATQGLVNKLVFNFEDTD